MSSLSEAKTSDTIQPAQPTLEEASDNYIVIFKPDVPTLHIKNQIQKMNVHQVNTTFDSNKTSSNTNHTSADYKSIGQFKWYSAQFHTEAIENLLKKNTTDEIVHYWVKDAKFSLQGFVQTNPPSWVKKIYIF